MIYVKQLDTLRAFAILSVVTTHWSSSQSSYYKISSTISAPFIFFTISGFLITRILLSERLSAEKFHFNKLTVYKNFFMRRALRVFPAYYLTIFIAYFLSNENISSFYPYLTYTTNFYQSYTQSWGVLPHLWSMAVEEQFYLVWPIIILFIPKSYLLPTIIFFILIGIISRCFMPNNDFDLTLPVTCFDALGLGALLAWVERFKPNSLRFFYRILAVLSVLSFGLIVVELNSSSYLYIFHRTFISVITAFVIAFFLTTNRSDDSKFSSLFRQKGLILIGKMSYGIFLYHITLINNTYRVLSKLNSYLPFPSIVVNPNFILLENFVILLLISYVSWKFFELPISNFKRYFKTEDLCKI
ncbi:MAG TPA: acyltransferase [Pedobacter sp.]|jgi:peptidoglycan/LPS O-acetylase OafA/YrhL